MDRPQKPFTTPRRNDSKTFQLTLNPSCGLPARICQEWKRRSFQDFPDELIQFRNPKTKNAAEAGAFALIEYLKRKTEEGTTRKVRSEDISVGAWIEKFTSYETSPRKGINASKNRPYSPATLDLYKSYYSAHIKDYPITTLRMSEIKVKAQTVNNEHRLYFYRTSSLRDYRNEFETFTMPSDTYLTIDQCKRIVDGYQKNGSFVYKAIQIAVNSVYEIIR